MVAPADQPRRVLHYQAALVRDQDGVSARCLELGRLCAHGRDALRGQALTPVLAGSIITADSRRGPVHLDYEVYSNTYRAFVLLLPRRRVTLGKPVRARWRA